MKIAKKVILCTIGLMICYCSGYLLNMFVTNRFVFDFKITLELLIAKNTFLYGFELFAVFMVINIFNWYKGIGKNPKKLMQVKDGNQNEIYTGLEQAHFETQKEIETNFNTVSYDDLPNLDIEGIPIIAEEGKKNYKITFAKPAHTLIIGTTGSGKTTTFINPTVQILANTKGKPSMLISDPKGELYALHAKSLIKRGYDVKVLDLRNPYCSIRWNPLEKPYEMYQEMLSLEDKVVVNEEEGYMCLKIKSIMM